MDLLYHLGIFVRFFWRMPVKTGKEVSRLNSRTWSLSFIFVCYIYTQRYSTWTWNVYLSYTQFIDQPTALHVDLRYMCLQLLYVVGLSIVLIIGTGVRVSTSKLESATSVVHHLTGYVRVSVHIMNSAHVVLSAKIFNYPKDGSLYSSNKLDVISVWRGCKKHSGQFCYKY